MELIEDISMRSNVYAVAGERDYLAARMLYGFDNDTPEGVTDERTKYVNWENGTAQGTMHVRAGDKRYVISRVTERTENDGRYSCWCLHG